MAFALTYAIIANKQSPCVQCQRTSPRIRLCGGCLSVYYCSRKCQFLHWEEHKNECSTAVQLPSSFVPAADPSAVTPPTAASTVWQLVAERVDDVVDLFRLRAVSRAVKAAVRSAAVTLNFDAYRSWNATKQATVAIQFPNARSLLIHNIFRDLADRHVAGIVCECRHLRHFAITQLYSADRVDLVQTWPQLSSACMTALAYHCPHLRSVYLPVGMAAVTSGINALALGCRSLRALTVCLEGNMRDDLLAGLRRLPHLRVLDVRKAPLSPSLVRRIRRCVALRAVRLVFAAPSAAASASGAAERDESGIDVALSELLNTHPRLRTLALCGLQEPQSLSLAARLPGALTRLDLSGCDALTDPLLTALCQTQRRLRAVDIARTRVTDAGLLALAELPALTVLQLRGVGRITGAGVAAIATAHGAALHVLELGGGGCRPDAPFFRALQSCTALRQLAVIDSAAECEAMEAALARMPLLEVLHITRALGAPPGLTDKAARRLLTQFTRLRVLSLPWHAITTRTVQAAARQLPQLAAIDLCRTDVGDVAMAALGACRRLQAVRVANTSVTDAGMEALVAQCPQLRFVETFGSRVSQKAAGRLTTRGISVLHEQTLDDRSFSVADFVVPLPYLDARGPLWAAAPPRRVAVAGARAGGAGGPRAGSGGGDARPVSAARAAVVVDEDSETDSDLDGESDAEPGDRV